ncbi:MAG TPA: hypothetical protein VMV87_19685 [Burkholderiales bacterium]|nr:hypothetical protein [Burkholderiales bacterium]
MERVNDLAAWALLSVPATRLKPLCLDRIINDGSSKPKIGRGGRERAGNLIHQRGVKMSKLLSALVAAMFAVSTVSVFAADQAAPAAAKTEKTVKKEHKAKVRVAKVRKAKVHKAKVTHNAKRAKKVEKKEEMKK